MERSTSRSRSPSKNSRRSPSRSPSKNSRSRSPSRKGSPKKKINLLDLPKDILDTEILGKLSEFEKVPLKITSKKLSNLIPKSSITGEEWQIKNAILMNDHASIKKYRTVIQKKLPEYWLMFLIDDDTFSEITPDTFLYVIDELYSMKNHMLLWYSLISLLFDVIQKYNKNTDVRLRSFITDCIKYDENVYSMYNLLDRNKLNLQHSEIKNLIKKLKIIATILTDDQLYYFEALKFLEILKVLKKY
jgi:hypothetical protein